MLLEAMGLHVPGAAFVHPHDGLREALTREAVPGCWHPARRQRFTPIGRLVDERCIVNAMVALLATGGSTNHLIHWVAVARAAGIQIDWTRLCRPVGRRAAAGPRLPQRQRRREPVPGRRRPGFRAARTAGRRLPARRRGGGGDPRGLAAYTACRAWRRRRLRWQPLPRASGDERAAPGRAALLADRRPEAAAGQSGPQR
jgi:phosphogluconate dehydratase